MPPPPAKFARSVGGRKPVHGRGDRPQGRGGSADGRKHRTAEAPANDSKPTRREKSTESRPGRHPPHILTPLLGQLVAVIMVDGRIWRGSLTALDHYGNICLGQAVDVPADPSEQPQPLGGVFLRSDQVVAVGSYRQ